MNWKTIGVSLLFTTAVLASDEFKSANVLYDAGKFADAAVAFERITPKTAAVFFNLGNAHFRLEQLGRAVLDFERARQLAPTDPDILANLRFAEERLGVAEMNLPAKTLTRFWESVIDCRTIAEWARYELVGAWLTVMLVAGAIWWSRLRTGFLILTMIAGGWLILTATILVCRVTSSPEAIVLTGKAEARFAPLADATVHFQLGEGTKVWIREDRGQWWFVERADGQQGWVKAEVAERVF